MWFDDAPDGDVAPVAVPASLTAAVVLSLVVTFVLGILPGLINDVTEYGPIAIGGR
jgi:hypothetical protein